MIPSGEHSVDRACPSIDQRKDRVTLPKVEVAEALLAFPKGIFDFLFVLLDAPGARIDLLLAGLELRRLRLRFLAEYFTS